MRINKIIKGLIPPFLLNLIRRIAGYGWYGDYKTWDEAVRKSTGYDSDVIINRIRESALKIRKGEAVYERDGVLFEEIEYSLAIISGLLYGALKNKRLNVIDFGGSLGTTYYQNKKFIDRLDIEIKWGIIEQKKFVDIGKKEFENEILKFYYDIESCINEIYPEILILSGVIQFIEKPYKLLENLLKYNFNIIIIDNIPFLDKDKEDKITIQVVPKHIYRASYPSWIFNKNRFISFLKDKGYEIIEIFHSYVNNDGKYGDFTFKGLLLEKKNV